MEITPADLATAGTSFLRHAARLEGMDTFLHGAFATAAQASGHPEAAEAAGAAGSHWSTFGAGMHDTVHTLGGNTRAAGSFYVDVDHMVSNRMTRSVETTEMPDLDV